MRLDVVLKDEEENIGLTIYSIPFEDDTFLRIYTKGNSLYVARGLVEVCMPLPLRFREEMKNVSKKASE